MDFDIQTIFDGGLQTLWSALFTFITYLIGKFLKNLTANLKENIESKHLLKIAVLAEKAVLNSYQTLVKDAKRKFNDKDGITRKELQSIKRAAKEQAVLMLKGSLKQLPELGKYIVEEKLGDWIEAAIPVVKKKLGAKTPETPPLRTSQTLPDQ